MAIYLLIASVCLIIGTAAIPNTAVNAIGNIGTITTCSIQGFFIQVSYMIAILYYCCLSLYSYFGVRCNFVQNNSNGNNDNGNTIEIGNTTRKSASKAPNWKWMEWSIHIGVHVFAWTTAIILVSQQAFNNTGTGFCHIESAPLACAGRFAHSNAIPCDRGPEGYAYTVLVLFILPQLFAVLGTISTMALLYASVRKDQNQTIYIPSSIVLYQTIIYLSVLLFTSGPLLLTELVFEILHGQKVDILFALRVFEYVMLSLFSVGSMCAYRYFATIDTKNEQNYSKTNNLDQSKGYIFHSQAITAPLPTTTIQEQQQQPASPTTDIQTDDDIISHQQKPEYSFNIFDGTQNAAGAFAEFIHDGDSNDEHDDQLQTDHWAGCQNHL